VKVVRVLLARAAIDRVPCTGEHMTQLRPPWHTSSPRRFLVSPPHPILIHQGIITRPGPP
jgi:hypothetical protein